MPKYICNISATFEQYSSCVVVCFQAEDEQQSQLPVYPFISYNPDVALQSPEQLFKLHVDKVCLFEADDFTQAPDIVLCRLLDLPNPVQPKSVQLPNFPGKTYLWTNRNCSPSTGHQNYKITPVSCKNTSAWVQPTASNKQTLSACSGTKKTADC